MGRECRHWQENMLQHKCTSRAKTARIEHSHQLWSVPLSRLAIFIGPRCPWSDLCVRMSVRQSKRFVKLNWCDSGWWRGILVILVMLQVWLEKNWKQWSVCFGCIFDMGLHWLKWEKKWASLKKISTLIFGKMFDFFVPRRSWQFPVKSDAKASISFARPWNSP